MSARRVGAALAGVLVATVLVPPAVAQTGPGPYARLVVMRPRPNASAEFEAGYRRHLDWHRQAGDPWSWHGWSVVLGERAGWFLDGTFGRALASLDSAVAPAEDARHNAAHVLVHADVEQHALLELVPALGDTGRGPPRSPYLEVTWMELQIGAEARFAQVVRQGAEEARAAGVQWYRLVAGGRTPTYVRLRPMVRLGAFASAPGPVTDLSGAMHLFRDVSVELLRYRSDLSYLPDR